LPIRRGQAIGPSSVGRDCAQARGQRICCGWILLASERLNRRSAGLGMTLRRAIEWVDSGPVVPPHFSGDAQECATSSHISIKKERTAPDRET
jgi:hypothetical protein